MLLLAIAAAIWLTGIRWVRWGGDWDLVFRVSIWGVIAGNRRRAALPRHHELEPGSRDPRPLVRAVRRLEGRARDLGRDPVRRARRAPGSSAAPATASRSSWTPSRRASCSPRRSAAGATGGTRSSTASTRRCRGRSRSTARAPRTPTTRPSSTSFSGTSSACSCCSGSTGASRCAGPRSSRSTSSATRLSGCTRRRCGSTRRATSSGQRLNFWVALVCFIVERRVLHLVAVRAQAVERSADAEARRSGARCRKGPKMAVPRGRVR